MATLDFTPAFQFGHPLSFALANRMRDFLPAELDHVFFTGSGSEANDTVLRMVRHYWAIKGHPQKKVVIGRWNGYHGSTSAGASLGRGSNRIGLALANAREQLPAWLSPIRRLKNGSTFADGLLPFRFPAPTAKVPEFSRKKSRFSGKKRLNRVRLTCC